MGIFNETDLVLDREDIKAVSEALFEAFYQKPALENFHTVVTGIKHDKQLAILGIYEGLSGKAKTTCGGTPNPYEIRSIDKTWSPKLIGDRFEQCFEPLLETFWKYSLKPGVEKDDLDGTDFAKFVIERILDAMVEGEFRHIWFGDTDAAHYGDSPAGFITNGVDLTYFNVIDGLWKQIFEIVAADSERKSVTDLTTKNALSTRALQKFNTADITNQVVTKAFDQLVTDADERLSTGTYKPMFIVTKSVGDQYKRERKFAFPNIDMAYERIENGISVLKSDGYDVVVFSFWDRIIENYEFNGTKDHLPHRIVYTTKENLLVGTEDTKSLSEFKAFMVEDTEKYVIKYAYSVDAKIGIDTNIQVAY